MANVDWHGMRDGTPPSSTRQNLNDVSDSPAPKGGDWKGLPDSTPASRPTSPDKE